METFKPQRTLTITFNPDRDTVMEIKGWPINTVQNQEKEPERIDIEADKACYSLVFTDDGPKLEIWEITPAGEIGVLRTTIDLPTF